MEDTAKYLIHADFVADGVVERSDVVGAVFGQTEGLLGDDLEIRSLQQSSKLGRIDVEVRHESGQSVGEITIASSLDRVETATLAAALEAIERIGPSHARIEVEHIEDVRAAKRREIVDRATELLATAFDEGAMDSEAILDAVRERVRVEDVTEYDGLPAGPNVDSSDAIVVVEGRADVTTLLKYGIKNAVAVEGTNVPESIAALTEETTVTAFLDGDRGGDLILRELSQVGDVDYVAFAPEGTSVEDLSRAEVDRALRNKVPASRWDEGEPATATDGSATPEPPVSTSATDTESPEATAGHPGSQGHRASGDEDVDPEKSASDDEPRVRSLADHVDAVADEGLARLLDGEGASVVEIDAEDVFAAVRDAADVPTIVVVDDEVTQRLVEVAAQRGVNEIVGSERGSFVKQPASVRVRTFADV
ncbi:MAG: DNA primase DnaG [Halanaeroarchaeum sp.]